MLYDIITDEHFRPLCDPQVEQQQSEHFLNLYHKMLSDVEALPKNFRNLKEGDTIYYIYYQYRGNGNKNSYIKLREYKVAGFSEYETEGSPSNPIRYNIQVMRPVTYVTFFSTDPSVELNKEKTEIKRDSLMFVYEDDMGEDTIIRDETGCAEALSLVKEKAVEAMKEFIETKMEDYSEGCDREIEHIANEKRVVKNEFRKMLNTLQNEDFS